MDKTSKKLTKDPKRVEAARKGRENYMNQLKESIVNDAKIGSGAISNESNATISANNTATTPATSTTNTATTRSSNTYIYGVSILAALGLYVLFTTKGSHP